MKENSQPAIVLLSGGLDSATTLAIAIQCGFNCHALSFSYGQRHSAELEAACRVAEALGAQSHRTINIDMTAIGGSALTDPSIDVPTSPSGGIPVTYVPARNTIFLAYALGYAEVMQAHDIYIGVNAVDYSGYPDCRPEYISAFQNMADLATREGVEGQSIQIHTPLIHLTKAQIIQKGVSLGIDYHLTVSCYQADDTGRACGKCDSCRLRRDGFLSAGVDDATIYQR